MVVSITPRRSNSPSAVSATTIPPASVQLLSVSPAAVETVRVERRGLANGPTVALTGAPNAISSAPATGSTDLAVALRVPADDSRVIILTNSFTYNVAWGDLDQLVVPHGSIVITIDGDLVATFIDEELRLHVD